MYGVVREISRSSCLIAGLKMPIGTHVSIEQSENHRIQGEVIKANQNSCSVFPFTTLDGVEVGNKAWISGESYLVYPSTEWLGRVINGFAVAIDGKEHLMKGAKPYQLQSSPPSPYQRKPLKEKITTGIKAIDTFIPCCAGQRLGIFAGTGVGKSVLLSMIARYSQHQINVIGLIGERGREVREFIEHNLGKEGMKKTVLVVSTSDESAVLRRQAAYLTLSIAEFFRDQNFSTLCIIDSVTRFAMAQREIGLASGEPPTSKGYTPSVFSELPKLLERAGASAGQSITGIFSVLVDGDDHDEPISDATRGILDGHIVLDRKIAEAGRFPAINTLKSVSRTTQVCLTEQERLILGQARQFMSDYQDMSEMIKMGLYKKGSNASTDHAIYYNSKLEEFLKQDINQYFSSEESFKELEAIIQSPYMEEK